MKIAVIGTGNIGGTLGSKWADGGHEVVYGVRSPGAPGTTAVADAVAEAEVAVLAIRGQRRRTCSPHSARRSPARS